MERQPTGGGVPWLVAAALVLAGCGREPARSAPEPSSAVRRVRSAEVRRALEGRTAVPAAVHARRRAVLSSRVQASVLALPFREGQRVAAGAVLARLDDRALRSGLLAAEAAESAAEADRLRMEALLARAAATPREAEASRARAAAAAAAVAAAREGIAYAVLRAPFAGTIAVRHAGVGDVAAPGAPLVEIEGLGGLELRASVEARLVDRLRPGLTLAALVDGSERPVDATVTAVSEAGDPATHRFEVVADLPPAPGLRSGSFARLLVPTGDGTARLLVPTAALMARGGLHGVFVVSDGTARLRWVSVGAEDGDATEVRAGLEAGERVALDPAALSEGVRVAPGETR